MTNVVHMSISNETLALLDSLKGSTSRSAYVAKLVQDEAQKQGMQVTAPPNQQDKLDTKLIQLISKDTSALKKDIELWQIKKAPTTKQIAEHFRCSYWTARTVQPIVTNLWQDWWQFFNYNQSVDAILNGKRTSW